MSLIRTFETRVAEAFGAAPQGYTAPFSFKRLAKAATKQMEAETLVIDGVDTAPALYTVLVSSADDVAMRPLYAKLTQELTVLIKSQAEAKGYSFVGEPLTRFLVDPKMRSGKFDVFAENIDGAVLERLRAEERSFLMGASAVGGAAADRRAKHATRRPTRRDAAEKRTQTASHAAPAAPASDGLIPLAPAVPVAAASMAPATPVTPASPVSPSMLDDSASLGLDVMPDDYLDGQVSASQLAVPAVDAPGMSLPSIDVPVTRRRVPAVDAPEVDADDASELVATCLLVDHQTGRTYVGSAPATVIGRERGVCGIVLHDPNVSRRHAQLTHDDVTDGWYLRDLGSTNGTLVNDVEISQCALHDGDLLTIGLMNLEFKEAR